ncbi:PREDICTED: uncharacterized protein LOC105958242 [Erythranthe guttata]|uniref:uncharacterized protein LOC105958242 n=1 Tax=Erythranthe guttata TaxID=4155 RepID=UPI00064DEDC1|nr:PREDICTED: uncharacterized protein LOC105958242 [Erythranthe guttata]|eukprot:XP_012837699.1 PREDICTED: uncharacterized protein LOC105958242 [Erythranthe guttata]
MVDKHAILFKELSPGSDPNEVELALMPIIARLHNIPMSLRSEYTSRVIGGKIGQMLEVFPQKPNTYGDFVRIRLMLDVNLKLKRGVFVQDLDGEKLWVSITYERLPSFCFLCGRIGHMEARCPSCYESDFVDHGSEFQYGTWLKASSSRDEKNSGLPLHNIALQPTTTRSTGSPPNVEMPGHLRHMENMLGNYQRVGKENSGAIHWDDSQLYTNSITMMPSGGAPAQVRKYIQVSNTNKKKRVDNTKVLDGNRATKRSHLLLRDKDLPISAEAAGQPSRD